jgi:spermidine/putrescine-binding protein
MKPSWIIAGILLATACGGDSRQTLSFYNWSYYIAESTIPDFEAETGVKVIYDNFSSNDELLAKLQMGAGGYDVTMPSDYMVEILVKRGLVHELDVDNIPNIENIDPRFRNLPFDPESRYSIPYQWGTTGIGVNTKYVKETIDSWNALWDPKYKGRISVIDNMRSGLVPALILLGYSVNETDPDRLNEARDRMIAQKEFVRTYSSDTYIDLLKSGDVWLAMGWSGDIYQVMKENPDVVFIIPKEGSYAWVDNLVIPKGSNNKELAESFLNYLLRPQVGADISNYTGYSTPNRASFPLVLDSLKSDITLYPPQDVLDRMEFLRDVGDATTHYNRIWNEIKSQ